jgi:AhpD family alkylhydroperoxidase
MTTMMNKQMDERTRELIAIGASIAAHCQPCLTYHIAKAKELGIDAQLIRTAMDIGHMIEKGLMSAMQAFAKSTFDAPPQDAAGCYGPGAKGCCS